jgi:hypothetical protein
MLSVVLLVVKCSKETKEDDKFGSFMGQGRVFSYMVICMLEFSILLLPLRKTHCSINVNAPAVKRAILNA